MDYAKLYARFIADRKAKEKEIIASGVYTEKHHIKPRSMGGNDAEENLIRLTAGDHYFAHLILAKCYGGKMWLAVAAMCNMPGATKRRDFLAKRRWVSIAREQSRVLHSENSKRLHKDPAFVAKLHSAESKAKRAKTMAHLYATTDLKARKSEGQRRAFAKPESRTLRSIIQKEVQNRPELAAKRAERMKTWNPMHNEKARKMVGQSVREYCAKPEVKAAKSDRLMDKSHPIHSAEARAKSAAGIKKVRESNPLAYSKTPVWYLGELRALKTVCGELGLHSSNISNKAKKEGKPLQEVFDWYLSTTPQERLAQRKVAERKAVLCVEEGIRFDCISRAVEWMQSQGKKSGVSSIMNCCKGRNKTAYGYTWRYA
jgi:hypothetical protein